MRPLVLVCLLAALPACSVGGSPDSGADELAAAARELVPPASEIVETREGACVQIAGNPACARVFLTSEGSEEERADELERTARAAGWEVVSREPRLDGILVELGREGYRAFAAIWEEARAAPCREAPEPSCADEIQVIEDV